MKGLLEREVWDGQPQKCIKVSEKWDMLFGATADGRF
jgi:hypothetical protein